VTTDYSLDGVMTMARILHIGFHRHVPPQ